MVQYCKLVDEKLENLFTNLRKGLTNKIQGICKANVESLKDCKHENHKVQTIQRANAISEI